MSQNVYVVEAKRPYVDYVLGLNDIGLQTSLVPLKLAPQLFAGAVDREENATFIVDISHVDLLNHILDVVHRSYPVSENVRLVVVSDLQTWSNTLPTMFANNITGGFRRRNPVAGALEKYSLENTLYDVARSGVISLKVMYLGLVYGGKGYDFEEVFMEIWSNKFVLPSPPSSSSASNSTILGHIHYDRLLRLVRDIVLEPVSFSSLIPAFDCNPRPLLDILISCNKLVNPEASPAVVEDSAVAVVTLLDKGKYAANVAAFIPTLLGSKHNFDKESNMEGQWNSIWNEFVASKGLRPVKLAVAGPPKTGKTEHAKTIADRLQIQYVDAFTAVQYVLFLPPPVKTAAVLGEENGSSEPLPPNDEELMAQLRVSIIAAIDAKLAEGAKPSKDKNAAPKTIVNADGVVDAAQVTAAVVAAAVNAELQRQCLRWYVTRDVTCLRRGFVLDVWDNEGLRALQEYLGNSDGGAGTTPPVDVIVELQCDDKALVQQLQESFGAGFAKNKEAQAAVKTLEASLASYSSALTSYSPPPPSPSPANDLWPSADFPNPENAGDEAAEENKGSAEGEAVAPKQVHVAVKGILEAFPTVVTLVQRDMTMGGAAANSGRAEEVAVEVVSSKEDALGWSRAAVLERTAAPAAVDTAATTGASRPVSSAVGALTASIDENAAPAPESSAPPVSVAPSTKPTVDTSKMKGLQAMNDFLTNTVLPVLGSGMIAAIRNDVADPIAFLSDYLLAESAERQARCEEEARQKFEDLLRNC